MARVPETHLVKGSASCWLTNISKHPNSPHGPLDTHLGQCSRHGGVESVSFLPEFIKRHEANHKGEIPDDSTKHEWFMVVKEAKWESWELLRQK